MITIASLIVLWSRGWSYANSVQDSDVVVELKNSDVNGRPIIQLGEQQFEDTVAFGQAIPELDLSGSRIVIQAEANVFHQQIDQIISLLRQSSESEIVLARKSSYAQ